MEIFNNNNRYRLGLFVGLFFLSFVILTWRDLFFFSKFVTLPEWALHLPYPLSAPAYLAGLSLLPSTLIPSGLKAASKAIAFNLVLSPILGLMVAAFEFPTKMPLIDILLNIVFNYIWAVGFHCALPAMVLIFLKLLVDNTINLLRKNLRRS